MTPTEMLRLRMVELSLRAEGCACDEYFLIVTPLGMPHARLLAGTLSGHGVSVVARHELRDWPAVSTLLYLDAMDERHLLKALAFEELWRVMFPSPHAEYWQLRGREDYERLVSIKRDIRRQLPKIRTEIQIGAETRLASLHAFHAPDPERVLADAARLHAAWPDLFSTRGYQNTPTAL